MFSSESLVNGYKFIFNLKLYFIHIQYLNIGLINKSERTSEYECVKFV